MTRKPRDREAERAALQAAAERLLAGTPLRSASGKLTGSELITESGLRRDVVYGDHKDLVHEFQARVKAQSSAPAAVEKVHEQNRLLKEEIKALKADLAIEREKSKVLTKIAVELSLELDQAKQELGSASAVTPLSRSRSSRPWCGGGLGESEAPATLSPPQRAISLRTASLTSGSSPGSAHWWASCSVRTTGSVFSTVTAKLNWRVVPPRLFW